MRRVVDDIREQEIRVGEFLLGKQDLLKTVTTPRGAFEMRILDPQKKRQVIAETAQSLSSPLSNVPIGDYLFTAACCTLQNVLVGWPEWWEGVDRCFDEELILELYDRYREFENEFRRRLRESRTDGSGKAVSAGLVGDRQVPGAANGRPLPPANGDAKAPAAENGGNTTDARRGSGTPPRPTGA